MTEDSLIEVVDNELLQTSVGYELAGLPLTPEGARKIIPKCCNGILRRADIIDRVFDYHEKNGGAHNSVNKTNIVKKALTTMLKNGEIPKQATHGYYEIKNEAYPREIILSDDIKVEPPEIECESSEMELPSALYAYYYPTYEQLAMIKGKDKWPIKIGMTSRSISERLASQATAFPEVPKVIISFNTQTPALLEYLIQAILKLRGTSCYKAATDDSLQCGSEWFMTNPRELQEILNFLHVEYNVSI